MPSQIPKDELDSAFAGIRELMGYLPSSAGRYLEKEVIGYTMPDAVHSYGLCVLRNYAHVLGELGEIPKEVADEIVEKVRRENVTYKMSAEWEDKLKHDIRGMVRNAQATLSDKAKNFVYPGLTSYDIINTSQSMALKDFAYELMIPKSIEFARNLIKKGSENKETIMVGRTHKQHAAATTVAHYVGEILGGFVPSLAGYEDSAAELRGKLSGFVGTNASRTLLFNKFPSLIDDEFFGLIGLKKDEMTGQVVHQNWYSDYFSRLVQMCGSIAKFASDLRNYQQTEVGEMFEQRLEEQVGSSTGAHKANPINSEQISGGRWNQLVAQLFASYQDFITDFQRDLRDSMNKRLYMENMTNIGYGMAKRAASVADRMTIRKEKMAENLGITQGLICAEPLQLYLQQWTGLNTDGYVDAHEHLRKISNRVRDEGVSFFELIEKDELIQRALKDAPERKREMMLKPEKYIGTCVRDFEVSSKRWEKQLYELERDIGRHVQLAQRRR
jgi:adenylosuccinate lyase